jgi:lysophospholipase L1-like esterase
MPVETVNVPREEIEWCDIWIPHANRAVRPRVLLIGDSITRQYYPGVDRALQGKAYVARLSSSRCVGDPVLTAEVTLVLQQYPFDIVHFNNGLHGFDVPEAEYDIHFGEYLALMQRLAPAAQLIWATTTPVRVADNLQQLSPRNERVLARNAIVQRHLANRFPVDDLYSVCEHHAEYHANDGVHYNEEGIAALAAQVAHCITDVLEAVSA